MISTRNAASKFGVLIVDMSEVELPGEAKQNNVTAVCLSLFYMDLHCSK
jgi:hypothetical protein